MIIAKDLAAAPSLDHAYLLSRLHYSPGLGLFWWKKKDGVDTKTLRWNKKNSGQIAGHRHGDYGSITLNDVNYRVHRLAWFYQYGEWPDGPLDHRNCLKLDNSIDNLRLASFSENNFNTPIYKSNTTGFKGVSAHEGKFAAYIKVHGTRHYKGGFTTAEAADQWVRAKREELHGEFCRHGSEAPSIVPPEPEKDVRETWSADRLHRICRECAAALTIGENWSEQAKAKRTYMCINCKRDDARKRKQLARARKTND